MILANQNKHLLLEITLHVHAQSGHFSPACLSVEIISYHFKQAFREFNLRAEKIFCDVNIQLIKVTVILAATSYYRINGSTPFKFHMQPFLLMSHDKPWHR